MKAAGYFDREACFYDERFSGRYITQLLRARVRRSIEPLLAPNSRVLDIGCGTGEDAIWLAQSGHEVTAIDCSSAMVETAKNKWNHHKSARDGITWVTADFVEWTPPISYDFALANFGVLNAIPDWASFARKLSMSLHSGSRAVLVPMGRRCIFEMTVEIFRGRFHRAFRRFSNGARAVSGDFDFPIQYATRRSMEETFHPFFEVERCLGLGAVVPTSEYYRFFEKFRGVSSLLNRVDTLFQVPMSQWSDHTLYVLKKR